MKQFLSKAQNPALLICGAVFLLIGVPFVVIGIAVGLNGNFESQTEALGFLLTFCLMGGIFAVLGAVFLGLEGKTRKNRAALLDGGNYVMAEVVTSQQDYSVNVNGRCGWRLICQYKANDGTVHQFKSRLLWFDPMGLLLDTRVPVYTDGEDFRHYYVDVDSVLPKVEIH